MMKAQERARNLLARRRQQVEHRRAAMLGRSSQEVFQSDETAIALQ
jgi:hypothetical protein